MLLEGNVTNGLCFVFRNDLLRYFSIVYSYPISLSTLPIVLLFSSIGIHG